MWGRISSLGHVVADFTKEVITANESDNEEDEFFESGESVTPRTTIGEQQQTQQQSSSSSSSTTQNNAAAASTLPRHHYQQISQSQQQQPDPFFSDSYFLSETPTNARQVTPPPTSYHYHTTTTSSSSSSTATSSHSTTPSSTPPPPSLYHQSQAHNQHQQLQHQQQQQQNNFRHDTNDHNFELRNSQQKQQQLLLEEQYQTEQKIVQLENMLRNKDMLISRLEKQLFHQTPNTANNNNNNNTNNSNVAEKEIMLRDCTKQVYDQLQQQLFSLLHLDEQIERENDVTVLLMDQGQLVDRWCELFDDSMEELNTKLNSSISASSSSSSTAEERQEAEEDDLFDKSSLKNQSEFASAIMSGHQHEELSQVCQEFRDMLSKHVLPFTSSLSTVNIDLSADVSSMDLKNQLIDILIKTSQLLSEQQRRVLDLESSQRQSQRLTKDSVEKFRFLYNSIVQLCQSNQVNTQLNLKLIGGDSGGSGGNDQSAAIDSIKLKDLMQLSKSLENHLKSNGPFADVCNTTFNSLYRLLNEHARNRVPKLNQNGNVAQNLMSCVASVEGMTRDLVDTNTQVIARLQQLQQKQMEGVDKENTYNQQLTQLKNKYEEQILNVSDNLNRQLIQLDKENKKLKNDLAFLSSNAHKSTEELESHIEEHEYEKQQLENRIAELQEELDSYDDLQREKQQLSEKVTMLTSQVNQYLDELKLKEETLSSLELALDSMQSDSKRKIKKLKSKVSEAEEATRKAEQQATNTRNELERMQKLKEERDQVIHEMKQDSEHVDRMRKQYDAMRVMLEDAIGRANDENLVDRRVINRLLMTLFDPSPPPSLNDSSGALGGTLGRDTLFDKQDNKVIALLCNTLRMDETQQRITTNSLRTLVRGHHDSAAAVSGSGIGGWFRSRGLNNRQSASFSSSESSYENKGEKSLSKLWVQFLIEESSKTPNNV